MNGRVSAQEGDYLIGVKRPVKFDTGIDPAQHRDAQSIGVDQRLALRTITDIHQLYEQAMVNERHQHTLSDLAEMTTHGTEQLAFRKHGW